LCCFELEALEKKRFNKAAIQVQENELKQVLVSDPACDEITITPSDSETNEARKLSKAEYFDSEKEALCPEADVGDENGNATDSDLTQIVTEHTEDQSKKEEPRKFSNAEDLDSEKEALGPIAEGNDEDEANEELLEGEFLTPKVSSESEEKMEAPQHVL